MELLVIQFQLVNIIFEINEKSCYAVSLVTGQVLNPGLLLGSAGDKPLRYPCKIPYGLKGHHHKGGFEI